MWLENEPLLSSSGQIPNNSLHSPGVVLLRLFQESGTLVNRKSNIRPRCKSDGILHLFFVIADLPQVPKLGHIRRLGNQVLRQLS